MPTMTDIMAEVQNVFKDLSGRVDDLDKENKRIREDLVSKGGAVPAESKAAVDALNARMDTLMDRIKEMQIEEKRSKLFGDHEDKLMQNEGTKAFLKLLRSHKALGNGGRINYEVLSPEELLHVSYQHMPEERKALYAGDATTGGFFASVDFQNTLKAYQILISPMRQVSTVIQTSGEKVEYPNLLNDTSAYYATEQATFAQSGDPTLGMLNIPVHEMRGFLQLSQQNMEDSMFPLESFLRGRLALKFAQREGTAFIRGNGNGQPRGIMAYSGSSSLAYNATATPTGKQTGLTYIPYIPTGAASGFLATNNQGDCLINALHDLKTVYTTSPSMRWCLTRTTLGILRLFKDSQGRPLWQPFAGANLPPTIYDFQYIEMPDMDELGTNNFPIILGDFSNYLIADRAGVNFSVRQLDELFALQGLVGFIARNRHGGDVLIPEAFRVIKCSVS
jgi:HK97 family phage major capsid protein